MSALVSLRPATGEDAPFLWRMVTLAAMTDGTDDDVARAKTDPSLLCYVEGFGRNGDLGVVAVRGEELLGAAWVRLAPGKQDAAKVWTDEVPELAIATLPSARGLGIGSLLLGALIDASVGRYPAIALTVREGNPAVRLYERFAFVGEGRLVNRVGTASLKMRRTLG